MNFKISAQPIQSNPIRSNLCSMKTRWVNFAAFFPEKSNSEDYKKKEEEVRRLSHLDKKNDNLK